MKNKILNLIKLRDQAFLVRFCEQGALIGEDGKTIHGVCKPVLANDVLTFMHEFDALILDESTTDLLE